MTLIPVLMVAALTQVQVRDEPKDWKLITTSHFDVYYPSDELLPRAREFAGWFEESYVDLVKKTAGEPRRVHVFLFRSFHDLLEASFFGSPKTEPPAGRIQMAPMALGLLGSGAASGAKDRGAMNQCRPRPHSRALAI